ncbi:MAG: hypothetical protein CMF45_01650 [Legionellales bacterium]|nr:hypothetical protein [Legionellales bacterium]
MTFGDKIALLYVISVRFIRTAIGKLLSKLLFKKQKKECKKILINRDGAFGDSIVALPALSVIRQNHPSAQIDLLSMNSSQVSFVELNLDKKLINNLYIVKKNERKKILKILRKENYDLFIQIPQNIGIYKSIRNMLLVRFYLNIRSAFGWDSGRIKSFLRQQKKFLKIPTETYRFLYSLKKYNAGTKLNYPIIAKKPKNLIIKNITSQKKIVVFLIGGKLQLKKWPSTNWAALANLIGDEYKVLILGGADEKFEADKIVSETKNTNSFCSELSIPELHYVLMKSAIAISHDTGAMHLCDAAKLKTIALFSTRDLSNKWHPNNKESIVIEKVLPCSFCLKTICSNNICMTNITPSEVYSSFEKLV